MPGYGFRTCSGGGEGLKVLFAGEYALEGSQEFGAAGILRDVTGGAQLLRTHSVLGIGVHAQYKHAHGGMTAADLLENVEAVFAGQGDIEDDEVPGSFGQADGGLVVVIGLAKYEIAELLTKHQLQALADQQMIINDEDGRHIRARNLRSSYIGPSAKARPWMAYVPDGVEGGIEYANSRHKPKRKDSQDAQTSEFCYAEAFQNPFGLLSLCLISRNSARNCAAGRILPATWAQACGKPRL